MRGSLNSKPRTLHSGSSAPADPSGDEVARLNAKVAELEIQLSVANAAQEILDGIRQMNENQLSKAFKAFLGCTKINPEGYGVGPKLI